MELLAPAGSPESLTAAVQSGADAVYLGYGPLNARRNAKNFSQEELRQAVSYCHQRGTKVYLTLNTLVTDRELPEFLRAAYEAHAAGVDALIVADLGGAAAIHRVYPEIELHASTQMSGHHGDMGKQLKDVEIDPRQFARTEAIILSMTKREREKPSIINPSRKRRIAAGCGMRVEDVNRLLKQYDTMCKLMKQMKNANKKGGRGGMGMPPGLGFGGKGGRFGF